MAPIVLLAALALNAPPAPAGPTAEEGFVPLFDGKSLAGWEANEKPECFTVADGVLTLKGGMAHLFYTGPVANHDFKNFEFKCDVKTAPSSNSGVFFHTANTNLGALKKGYEAQINNTFVKDPRKTGSLVVIEDLKESAVKDGEWFECAITVRGKRITIALNGKAVVDYTEPEKPERPKGREQRVLSRGTFALQAHDPGSTTQFKNVRVKVLPD